jgi:hypothetical protein
MLVCSERRVLVAGGWFVLKEKYCWLVADKPSEQAVKVGLHIYLCGVKVSTSLS